MSGRKSQELEGITLLGNQKTKYPDDYAPEVLETFENKHPENDYFVKFNAPEFTSLCPITGQPDFATIYISYVPGERMVESKSFQEEESPLIHTATTEDQEQNGKMLHGTDFQIMIFIQRR